MQLPTLDLPNMIGIVGVVMTLLAYYWLNINKVSSESLSYVLLNLIGSCLILVSIYFYWNLSSFLIEVAWILISLVGLCKVLRSSSNG